MSHPHHHAISSVKKWGGTVEDYIAIHSWFDESKSHFGDFRHRALRHHTQGIFECERTFGVSITLENGRVIPVRWIGEQHVIEDMGRLVSLSDWLDAIKPEEWMDRYTRKLAIEFKEEGNHD